MPAHPIWATRLPPPPPPPRLLQSFTSPLRSHRGWKPIITTTTRAFGLVSSRTYDDAIDCLNTLQTPYAVLEARWRAGTRVDTSAYREMTMGLRMLGYEQRDLTSLNIVHVAGTKGKGSTCAYVESILSHHHKVVGIPHSIGLYTSPHLIAVRERIRLNSMPLSRVAFARYFFEVWDALELSRDAASLPHRKPVYFRFLTLMSYHVFLREHVHVAIYETGIGGEYDATNVVDHPVVTGITALGHDHTFNLGETIGEIAWHKAGIQKPSVPSFTVPQLPEAMAVIQQRAEERGVQQLQTVDLDPRLHDIGITPNAPFQKHNASLAIALASTLLQTINPSLHIPASHPLPTSFITGLETVRWRGRCERKADGNITWHLDGAHTPESIAIAAQWFRDECVIQDPHGVATRILIFNQQGHREAVALLQTLHAALAMPGTSAAVGKRLSHVIFCSNAMKPDESAAKQKGDYVNHGSDTLAVADLSLQKEFQSRWREWDAVASGENSRGTSEEETEVGVGREVEVVVLPFVEDALEFVRAKAGRKVDRQGKRDMSEEEEMREGKAEEVNVEEEMRGQGNTRTEVKVLITGSLHLVGRALGVLEGVDAL